MEPKAELHHHINDLTDYILDISPDAHVEFEPVIYEDEHANLTVYPPLSWTEECCLALQHKIGERVSDMHVETGYLILVYVCTPEQQVAEAQLELVRVKKKIQSAEKVLAEAVALGLLKVEAPQMELVAV